MLPRKGSPLPEKRQAGREILTARVPAHEDLLSGLPSNLDIVAARSAVKVLWAARNAFDIRQRGRGIFAERRISKRDADIMLKREMALLTGGGAS